MAQSKLYPVVMAGGSGSRLWPLSRVLYPKQFLCLKGDLTMLQTTICRLNGVECESPVVICNEQHRFIVAEQLRQLNKLTENIILEPAGRNTAPAIALAALAGLAVLYAVGLPYMAMILNGYMGKGMDLSAILWAGMLPFLPGDALKILVTAMLTPPIRRALDNSAK